MGGYGSTRWNLHTRKCTVEECLSLDTSRWSEERILQPEAVCSGWWRWLNRYTGETTSTIGYEVNTTEYGNCRVRLDYTVKKTQERVDYLVRLQTTRPYFGGQRWWFTCPLFVNGFKCDRRVRKLYLPPSARYFGCRHCYNLTYRSAQEHDKRVDFFRKHPWRLMALMRDRESPSVQDLILGLKALR